MLAELERSESEGPACGARPRRWVIGSAASAVVVGLAAIGFWMNRPSRAHVNFVTHPFEATIYLDDELLVDVNGNPYTTPCTVEDLPSRVCRVVFKHGDKQDPLDMGLKDLAKQRRIEAHWGSKQ
jgi:hypothetical protein